MLGVKYTFIEVYEIPDKLELSVVYICNEDKRIEFICPCGCHDRIVLGMLINVKPCWKIDLITNSIEPSINRQIGCRSHFKIINGVTQ